MNTDWIMETQIEECKQNNSELIYLSKFGSHLYGTNSFTSDLDFIGICKPNKFDLLFNNCIENHKINNTLQFGTNTSNIQNTKNDIDYTIITIQKMIQLFLKGETIQLDLYSIFCTYENIKLDDDIISNLKLLLMNSGFHGTLSFIRGKLLKYLGFKIFTKDRDDLPKKLLDRKNKVNNISSGQFEKMNKSLQQCLKLLVQLKNIILNGEFEFPLDRKYVRLYDRILMGFIPEDGAFEILFNFYKQVIYLKNEIPKISDDKRDDIIVKLIKDFYKTNDLFDDKFKNEYNNRYDYTDNELEKLKQESKEMLLNI